MMSFRKFNNNTRERKKDFRKNTFRLADKKASNGTKMLKRKRTNQEKLTFEDLDALYDFPEIVLEKQKIRLLLTSYVKIWSI